MFEIVRAIHQALHTESTLVFVLVVAGVFAVLSGGTAYLVDEGYKNTQTVERQTHQRHLTTEQVVGIEAMADNFPKDALLYVRIPTDDIEAQNYGKEIWAAFGGKVKGSLVSVSGADNPNDGLSVAAGLKSQSSGNNAAILIEVTFIRLGVPFNPLRDFALNGVPIVGNQVHILVGPNPKVDAK
jgi:hypothetical protein